MGLNWDVVIPPNNCVTLGLSRHCFSMLQTYILPISEIVQETADAISLHFDQPKVDRIPYYAGQYITLKVEIAGETHFRSYSMSSSPQLDEDLTITIKKLPGGLVSNFIHDNWKAGSQVEFLRPAGSFVSEFATKHRRQLVCIAGGSGITPIYAILRGILFQEPYSQVSLLYANKTPQDTIFKDQLDDLQNKFPERFQLTYAFSRSGGTTHLGRLDKAKIAEWAKRQKHQAQRDYYICGPQGLIDMTETCLMEIGVPYKKIKKENFVSTSDMELRQNRTLQPARQVKVILGEQTHQFLVPTGATILEAALSQGIDLPYSCKRGNCASCMGNMLHGSVEMNDPSALLEFEVEAGKVLTCQAIPTEEGVEIRIGI